MVKNLSKVLGHYPEHPEHPGPNQRKRLTNLGKFVSYNDLSDPFYASNIFQYFLTNFNLITDHAKVSLNCKVMLASLRTPNITKSIPFVGFSIIVYLIVSITSKRNTMFRE